MVITVIVTECIRVGLIHNIALELFIAICLFINIVALLKFNYNNLPTN